MTTEVDCCKSADEDFVDFFKAWKKQRDYFIIFLSFLVSFVFFCFAFISSITSDIAPTFNFPATYFVGVICSFILTTSIFLKFRKMNVPKSLYFFLDANNRFHCHKTEPIKIDGLYYFLDNNTEHGYLPIPGSIIVVQFGLFNLTAKFLRKFAHGTINPPEHSWSIKAITYKIINSIHQVCFVMKSSGSHHSETTISLHPIDALILLAESDNFRNVISYLLFKKARVDYYKLYEKACGERDYLGFGIKGIIKDIVLSKSACKSPVGAKTRKDLEKLLAVLPENLLRIWTDHGSTEQGDKEFNQLMRMSVKSEIKNPVDGKIEEDETSTDQSEPQCFGPEFVDELTSSET